MQIGLFGYLILPRNTAEWVEYSTTVYHESGDSASVSNIPMAKQTYGLPFSDNCERDRQHSGLTRFSFHPALT